MKIIKVFSVYLPKDVSTCLGMLFFITKTFLTHQNKNHTDESNSLHSSISLQQIPIQSSSSSPFFSTVEEPSPNKDKYDSTSSHSTSTLNPFLIMLTQVPYLLALDMLYLILLHHKFLHPHPHPHPLQDMPYQTLLTLLLTQIPQPISIL